MTLPLPLRHAAGAALCALACTGPHPLHAQTAIPVEGGRKAVRTAGDVGSVLLPTAAATAILLHRDWQGARQGVLAGACMLGSTILLKQVVKKERPDGSDLHSFPSRHTAVAFTAATFLQCRYGWKWGVPAYAASAFVGWSRIYGKKHDAWDVVAGAAIGTGCALIFTRPFSRKHNLALAPVLAPSFSGIHASMNF